MKLTTLLLLFFLFALQYDGHAATCTWTGGTSSDWNDDDNWSGSVPVESDDVVIVSGTNNPVLTSDVTVHSFTINSGDLDLDIYNLTIQSAAYFNGGYIFGSGLLIINSEDEIVFQGTEFSIAIEAEASDVYFNGSLFNDKASVTKTGASDNISVGGNVFLADLTLINNSGASIHLSDTANDIYEGFVQLQLEKNSRIYFNAPASACEDTTYFGNGIFVKVVLSDPETYSQESNQLIFGNKLIVDGDFDYEIGAYGDSMHVVHAYNDIFFNCDAVINGNVTFGLRDSTGEDIDSAYIHVTTAGSFEVNGNYIQGIAAGLGAGFDSAWVDLTAEGSFVINGTTNIGLQGIYGAYFSAATVNLDFQGSTEFHGDAAFVIYGSSASEIRINPSDDIHFYASNILVHAGHSNVLFGSDGGACTIDSSSSLSVELNNSILNMKNFTVNDDASSVSFGLDGNSELFIGNGCVFNCPIYCTTPAATVTNSTFNNEVTFVLDAASAAYSSYGNHFSDSTTIIAYDGAEIHSDHDTYMAAAAIGNFHSSGNTVINSVNFNGSLWAACHGMSIDSSTIEGSTGIDRLGGIMLIGETGDVEFHGDVYIEAENSDFSIANYGSVTIDGPLTILNNTGNISFGSSGGVCTANSSVTVTLSDAGNISVKNFIQSETSDDATFMIRDLSANCHTDSLSVINSSFTGVFQGIAPYITIGTNEFENKATFVQTGTVNSFSAGGNTFNGFTILGNIGNGDFYLAQSDADEFNDGAAIGQLGETSRIYPAYTANSSFKGDVLVYGSEPVEFGADGGTTTFNGSADQLISMYSDDTYSDPAVAPVFHAMEVDKPDGFITLEMAVDISGELTLQKGVILTDSINILTLTDDATCSGGSDSSYVHGPVAKIGDDAFVFPLGDTALHIGAYHPLSISAPDSINDAFRAQYFAQEQTLGDDIENTIENLSTCEYWMVNRDNGESDVIIGLGWNKNSCNVFDPSDMKVAAWDDSLWTDQGNGGTDGDAIAGSVISYAAVSSLGVLTLADNLCTSISATTSTLPDYLGGSTGIAQVNATHGTPPYTYIWSNAATSEAISSLSIGTYSVTVTDHNGCTTTAIANVDSILTGNGLLGKAIDYALLSGDSISAIDTVYASGKAGASLNIDNYISATDGINANGIGGVPGALADLQMAINYCNVLAATTISNDFSDQPYAAGVYSISGTAVLNHGIDLTGDSDGVYIFVISDSLRIQSGASVNFNKSRPQNIFWVVNGKVIFEDQAIFSGIIMSSNNIIYNGTNLGIASSLSLTGVSFTFTTTGFPFAIKQAKSMTAYSQNKIMDFYSYNPPSPSSGICVPIQRTFFPSANIPLAFGGTTACDQDGHLYMAGQHNRVNTIFFTNTTYGPNLTLGTINGYSNFFLAQYNTCGELQWLQTMMDGNGYIVDMAVGTNKHVYVVGGFSSTNSSNVVQFFSTAQTAIAPFATTLSVTGVSSHLESSQFIAEYNEFGVLLWVNRINIPVGNDAGIDNLSFLTSIAVDQAGNVYVSGVESSGGSMCFYPNPSSAACTTLIHSTNKNDILVAKYDQNGNLVWHNNTITTCNGSAWSCNAIPNSIAVDNSDNSYITGSFSKEITIAGRTYSTTTSGNTDIDIFVAKLGPTGIPLWGQQGGYVGSNTYSTDAGNGIVADLNGNCYVTGEYSGDARFYNTPITSNGFQILTNIGAQGLSYNMFLVKYDTYGKLEWMQKADNSDNQSALDITIDNDCLLAICGGFKGTTNFYNDVSLSSTSVKSLTQGGTGYADGFVAIYNSDGVLQLARSYSDDIEALEGKWISSNSGPGFASKSGICTDKHGNYFISGFFENNPSFGSGNPYLTNGADAYLTLLPDAYIATCNTCSSPATLFSNTNPNIGQTCSWLPNGETTPSISATSGTYSVTMTDACSCSSTANWEDTLGAPIIEGPTTDCSDDPNHVSNYVIKNFNPNDHYSITIIDYGDNTSNTNVFYNTTTGAFPWTWFCVCSSNYANRLGGMIIVCSGGTPCCDTLYIQPCCYDGLGTKAMDFTYTPFTCPVSSPFCVANGIKYYLAGSLHLMGPKRMTFRNCTFYLQPGFFFELDGNANVTFDNCTLQSGTTCDPKRMWVGIKVQSGSTLNLINNTHIYDAENAVIANDGSYYNISNSYFDRNFNCIKIPRNANRFNDVNSNIDNTIFEGKTLLIREYYGQKEYADYPNAGIVAYDNYFLNVGAGNSNVNILFRNLNYGIYAVNTNTFVGNSKFINMRKTLNHPPYDKALTIGVGIYQKEGILKSQSNFTAPEFQNCKTGIFVEHADATISNNTMNNVGTGIEVRENALTNRIHIYSNWISATSKGISCWMNNGAIVNINASNNISIIPGGFNANPIGIAVYESKLTNSRYYVDQNNIDMAVQGIGIRFGSVQSSWASLSGGTESRIWGNNITEYATTSRGIDMSGNVFNLASCNNVRSMAVMPANTFGIRTSQGIVNFILCNTLENTFTGSFFAGGGTFPHFYAGNGMTTHNRGVLIQNGNIIGDQGSQTFSFANTWNNIQQVGILGPFTSFFFPDPNFCTSPLAFRSTPTNYFVATNLTECTIYSCPSCLTPPPTPMALSSDIILERSDTLIAEGTITLPDEEDYQGFFQWSNAKALYKKLKNDTTLMTDSLFINFYDSIQGTNIPAFLAIEDSVEATDSILRVFTPGKFYNDSIIDTTLSFMKENAEAINTLLNSGGDLLHADSVFIDSVYAVNRDLSMIIDSLKEVNDDIVLALLAVASERADMLETINSGIAPDGIHEENLRTANEIYLSTIARRRFNFTEDQADNLLAIASQCPDAGGPAVFFARSMYKVVNDTLEFNDDALCTDFLSTVDTCDFPPDAGAITGPANGICGSDSVTYSISSVSGATGYKWFIFGSGATIHGADSLDHVAIDFGSADSVILCVAAHNACGSSATSMLTVSGVPAKPDSVTYILDPSSFECPEEILISFNIYGSESATGFDWSESSYPIEWTVNNDTSISVTSGGFGHFVVRATNDCGASDSVSVDIDLTCPEARIAQTKSSVFGKKVEAYPNPTTGFITIRFESGGDEQYVIEMLDLTGRIALNAEGKTTKGLNHHELDMSKLEKGIYFISLRSLDRNDIVKIILQ